MQFIFSDHDISNNIKYITLNCFHFTYDNVFIDQIIAYDFQDVIFYLIKLTSMIWYLTFK